MVAHDDETAMMAFELLATVNFLRLEAAARAGNFDAVVPDTVAGGDQADPVLVHGRRRNRRLALPVHAPGESTCLCGDAGHALIVEGDVLPHSSDLRHGERRIVRLP